MFDQASKDHGISLQESLMIGDSVCDIEAAIGCKMDSVLVLTGKGKAASKNSNISPMFIEKNLLTASHTLRKMK
jgi:histidinol phosphatase-like enzyme